MENGEKSGEDSDAEDNGRDGECLGNDGWGTERCQIKRGPTCMKKSGTRKPNPRLDSLASSSFLWWKKAEMATPAMKAPSANLRCSISIAAIRIKNSAIASRTS